MQKVSAAGSLEIDTNAPLVSIDGEEVGAFPFNEGRPPASRIVAVRRLDLQHLRTQIPEDHGAVRTRQNTREVENRDP